MNESVDCINKQVNCDYNNLIDKEEKKQAQPADVP
jgi:hypothetical protein